ncbi:MAG: hypothetical protein JOY62_05995 [Acidobacteriaceae bacterium]|nr:hypothetical protein [Acidobacteriaceae bacterium]
MVESKSDKSNTERAGSPASEPPNTFVRSSRFKYYIHDGVSACRLQLIGELTSADLEELNGCWRTAKTTLGNRKLILDLRDLTAIDEDGRQWVSSMTVQGAVCASSSLSGALLPSNGVIHSAIISAAAKKNPRSGRRLGKLLAILRTLRIAFAGSPTQAQ